MPIYRLLFGFFLLQQPNFLFATPPYIEHQVYYLNERCFNLAVDTLRKCYFRQIKAFGEHNQVFGVRTKKNIELKASILCISYKEAEIAVFSVSGLNFSVANDMAYDLKKRFEELHKVGKSNSTCR